MLIPSARCRAFFEISRNFPRRNSTSTSSPELLHSIRALLRETAQPVAVVTSFMPPERRPKPLPKASSDAPPDSSHFHGATLSSFTSISMEPHPLVAFALRIPSRMATTLSTLSLTDPGHMVINLLSATQAHHALLFSRPDIHARPFDAVPWSASREGLPVLHGSLGALSCRLVTSAPLHDLDALDSRTDPGAWGGAGVASKLYVAQVIRVEDAPRDESVSVEDDALRTMPLLYHRRGYATTGPLPSGLGPPPVVNGGK